MKLASIQIRDPFVFIENGDWYLTGSTDKNIWRGKAAGFDAYKLSANLAEGDVDLYSAEWEGPIPLFRPDADFWSETNFWAAEIHKYEGAYYIFATFLPKPRADGTRVRRGTAILKSMAGVSGPYKTWSFGPVTPPDWECLDGTFIEEGGKPHMVFCHEWQQVADGEICVMQLSPDLRESSSPPRLLFRASEARWAAPLKGRAPGSYVTDGPFMHKLNNGKLSMLWSSFDADGNYCLGIAYSEGGSVFGPWRQSPEPLYRADGGHGMIFKNGNKLYITVHKPNKTPNERAVFLEIFETGGELRL